MRTTALFASLFLLLGACMFSIPQEAPDVPPTPEPVAGESEVESEIEEVGEVGEVEDEEEYEGEEEYEEGEERPFAGAEEEYEGEEEYEEGEERPFAGANGDEGEAEEAEEYEEREEVGEVSEPEPESAAPQKRVIEVTAQNWAFSPATITAKQGEVLEVLLQGIEGTHGFSVPDLGINVAISAGETKTVAIPTNDAGTFDFRCSIPCGAGHSGMAGRIVIEP